MAIKVLIERFHRTVRDLHTANGANVTVIFALALLPMVGFVGAAVDYSHANSVKTAMQAASDSTALMLSKTAATLTTGQLQTQGTNYFKALFTRPEATGLQVNSTYTTTNGSQVVVTASADVKANFMGLMGVSTMKVGVDSQVKWGNSRLRVALVLDNTGSMADAGKITALQTATNKLLDQLKNAASSPGDVYVSIVPFVKDVNVGKNNYNATWIDWSDWDNANPGANHNTWNGCVTDRGNKNTPTGQNYDTNVNPPGASKQSKFPAEQYDPCPQAVMPLSYDWTGMKNLVNAMQPGGNTNQAIGLVHGWQSLVGGGPYPTPPAMDPKYKYSQVIILLTDGLNTQDRWYTSQNSIDNRQAMTCNNIKAAGITLYTIQVNTGGDPTSSLLRTCATDSSKFFLLTSSTQIVSTFQQIGTNLSNLRIAQ